LKSQLRTELIYFETKDCFVKCGEMQGPIKVYPGVCLQKVQNFKTTSKIAIWIENGAVSWTNCSLPISASVSTVTDNVYVSA